MLSNTLNYAIAMGVGALLHKYATAPKLPVSDQPKANNEMSIFGAGVDGDDVTIWDCSAKKFESAVGAAKPNLIVRVGFGGNISPKDEKAFCAANSIAFKHFKEMPTKSVATLNAKFTVLWHLTNVQP